MKIRRKIKIGALIFIIIISVFSIYLGKKHLFNEGQASLGSFFSIKKEKSKKIIKYRDSVDNLVEEVDLDHKVSAITSLENDRYLTKLFDYASGQEITITDIIKPEKQKAILAKITELLYLKYPKFIADVLKTNEKNNVYYLKTNELVIYYYDYEIEPMPKDSLYLRVNYNEIKDYLDITVNLDATYENEDGSKVDSQKKLIAITFDDGPGPYTSSLIDTLLNNKATATFFMLGKNIPHYEEAVKKAYTNKMEIGYHSYAHTSFKRQKLEDIKAELTQSNNNLRNIINEDFSLIRPPYGAINEEIKESLDYPFILWNIDTEDWRYRDSEYLTNYVLEHAQDGNIILFHDIHKTSVEAIEKLLPQLYVEGFQITTVSNLAKIFNVTLENHKAYRGFTR